MDHCKRILILNEDWGFGVALAKILLKEGFQVESSNSPQQALQLINESVFELLIVDLSQKESWFWDLVQQVPQNLPPLIFLSPSLTNFLKFQKLPRSENFLFLEKPVNREELVDSINELLVSKIIPENGKQNGFVKEIRIHGRGGQGVVTAAELLALAAFEDGKYVCAFPFFGSERMGAPVQSFVRISNAPIRDRSQIKTPDILVVQDPTLIGAIDILAGLKPNGMVLVDTEKTPAEIGLEAQAKIVTVPATKIALEEIGRPIQNTTLLGALAGSTGLISWESICQAFKKRFAPELAEKNIQSAQRAFNLLKEKVHANH